MKANKNLELCVVIFEHRTFLLIILLALYSFNSMKAQFVSAAIVETIPATTSITSSDNSGNDIVEWNSTIIEVTVLDDISSGTNSGIAWKVQGGNSGFINFNFRIATATDYLDPDVILIDDESDLYAVAVYMEVEPNGMNNDSYFAIECFLYNSGPQTFTSQGTTQIYQYNVAGPIPNPADFEINIDGANEGNERFFGITWNDVNGRYVFAQGGFMDECVQMCDGYYTVFDRTLVSYAAHQTIPDIALNSTKCFFTFLTLDAFNNQYTEVYSLDQVDLCDGGGSPSNVYTIGPPSLGEYATPRIACPNTATAAGSNDNDYHVVVAETDLSTTWAIVGLNYFNGAGTNIIAYYNDGLTGNSPQDITDVPNTEPVVTYSEGGDILVGWLMDNRSGTHGGNAVDALYPLVVNCDRSGNIIGGASYMNVPHTNNFGSNDSYSSLSIAGRYCTCPSSASGNPMNLFSLAKNGDDLYTKIVVEGSTALRIGRHTSSNLHLLDILELRNLEEHLFNEEFDFILYDLLNRRIIRQLGTPQEINAVFNNAKMSLSPGIYLGNLVSTKGEITLSEKIIINR